MSKSKSYMFKLKQNDIREFLSISFPKMYHRNGPTIEKQVKHAGSFRLFSGFSLANCLFKEHWESGLVSNFESFQKASERPRGSDQFS